MTWEPVLNGRLQSRLGLPYDTCLGVTETFVLDGDRERSERFLRFEVKTAFSAGGGLQFIDFEMGNASG